MAALLADRTTTTELQDPRRSAGVAPLGTIQVTYATLFSLLGPDDHDDGGSLDADAAETGWYVRVENPAPGGGSVVLAIHSGHAGRPRAYKHTPYSYVIFGRRQDQWAADRLLAAIIWEASADQPARTSTADPVADLRAAAAAIREDHPAIAQGSRFWEGIAGTFGRAADAAENMPDALRGRTLVAWNQTVGAARDYLDHGAGPVRP